MNDVTSERPAREQALLDVRGLTVLAPSGATLVSDVTFSVGRGERVGLIGESGSGKSVTSLALTRLLAPGFSTSGSVLLDGVATLDADEASLRKLRGPGASMVFQESLSALDPLMRVGKQIAEPLKRHRGLRGDELAAAVSDALAEMRLTDSRIARAFPHELSGGQRQRVAIAIALASRPALLIADEPTTALDVTVQREVLALLDRLVAERGMSLLFISHDLAVVARMVDHIVVMQQGGVVEQGAAADVIDAPQHAYTEQLIASARAFDDALGDAFEGEGEV
ncbi:ABC transporter ATP-binding protein [Leucobacter sp. UCMA 4100]|uniref:ATP-binding cassette domain-containing protein n=1 Tax=Leucobacter sp. UCMA 4100 TaxID=2810534 RepID=UPI0022EB387B|nr:ABC transporter ATP-binding protein [Leucobacter sp. UCMA 4100]MDA3146955.1 ABC transporter ATP-binding protein [Leucobacter sp. UCMA 4100]